MKTEKERFQSQYTERQWGKLCADSKFKDAWEAQNFIRAGEIANSLIFGDVMNITAVRSDRKIRDLLGDLME